MTRPSAVSPTPPPSARRRRSGNTAFSSPPTWNGRHIEVRRSRGLTELVVDGRVYGRKEVIIEREHTISARIDGHDVATVFYPTGRQTIEVDGEVIAKKQRLY